MIRPEFMRMRIAGLHNLRQQFTSQLKTADKKAVKGLELYIAQLRNGVYPDVIDADGIEFMVAKNQSFSTEPLTFTELTTFNTWFTLHPEKVCGQLITTSSRNFPVSVKGTKEDVELAIDKTLSKANPIELEAKALEIELDLINL